MIKKVICPCCNGSKRVPAGDVKYKSVIAGYDAASDTFECTNCGGQYMYGRPTGEVNIDKNGNACVHSYKSNKIGRCLTEYICEHCGDKYHIDSGG
jgi:hypothetical protein